MARRGSASDYKLSDGAHVAERGWRGSSEAKTSRSEEEQLSRIQRSWGSTMQDLARRIEETLPPGVAFALVTFDAGAAGYGGYISNAERDDMIMALRESADKLEKKLEFPPGASLVSH